MCGGRCWGKNQAGKSEAGRNTRETATLPRPPHSPNCETRCGCSLEAGPGQRVAHLEESGMEEGLKIMQHKEDQAHLMAMEKFYFVSCFLSSTLERQLKGGFRVMLCGLQGRTGAPQISTKGAASCGK